MKAKEERWSTEQNGERTLQVGNNWEKTRGKKHHSCLVYRWRGMCSRRTLGCQPIWRPGIQRQVCSADKRDSISIFFFYWIGHPIGATGLGQCAELNWQLRGVAGRRQVEGSKVALQHNFGLGSAAVVTLYRKYSPWQHPTFRRPQHVMDAKLWLYILVHC